MDLTFLLALKVGEHYAFDIRPTPSETLNKLPRSMWVSYRTLSNALNKLRATNRDTSFVMRVGKWSDKATRYKVLVYCTRKGDERMDKPPPTNDYIKMLARAAKKDKGAKALQEELAQPAPPPVAQLPPHMRTVTVDDQKELVRLVQADARGETIQILMPNSNEWLDLSSNKIDWSAPINRLRIKPKPRRMYYVENVIGTRRSTPQLDEAKRWGAGYTTYREVFPEDEE